MTSSKKLDFTILAREWLQAISENTANGTSAWAVYVSMTGEIQARPQDDKFWALFVKANAWGADSGMSPQKILQDPNVKKQLEEDYQAILRF